MEDAQVAQLAWADLLANDTDADLDGLSIAAVGDALPPGAKVALAGDFVVYTPPPGKAGDGSFTYTLSDGRGGHRVTGMVKVTAGRPVPAVVRGPDVVVGFKGEPGTRYRVQYMTGFKVPAVWEDFS